MANRIKSGLKRNKTSERNRIRNNGIKSTMRTEIKKTLEALSKDDKELAASSLKSAIKSIDTAESKGAIHKNTASRNKSRLTKKYNTKVSTEG